MLDTLIWVTGALCVLTSLLAWKKYHDVFHPIILVSPMFAFMYVYMPARLIHDGQLYSYVTEDQGATYQAAVLLALGVFFAGCLAGSASPPKTSRSVRPLIYDPQVIRKGGYLLGALGFAAWIYAVQSAGGMADVFSRVKGYGWSDWGFIRESAYLMIVGLLLLLSPEGFNPKDKRWRAAVVMLAIPYLIQGLLGAQRGPTFLVVVTLGMSWYLARRKRPSVALVLGGGAVLGFLMLLLVMNRSRIYLGSEQELQTDVSGFFEANEANEYIFGAGCFTASNQTGQFFWGKRYLAQILVRPVPRQIWPTKYEDFGIPEIAQNAGVAGGGLQSVMGWSEIPGAAAGMVADVWVELSWLSIPFLGLVGWLYGYTWRRAIWQGGPWITLLTITILLSVYFISQSGEAVIFRFLILSVPCYYVWQKAGFATGRMKRTQAA